MRPRTLLVLAALITGAHFVLRGIGAGVHTSIIAGMPQNDASFIVGPLYALSWLAFVAIAPVLVLAATLEIAWAGLKDKSTCTCGAAPRWSLGQTTQACRACRATR